jgi:hypothetical protein
MHHGKHSTDFTVTVLMLMSVHVRVLRGKHPAHTPANIETMEEAKTPTQVIM